MGGYKMTKAYRVTWTETTHYTAEIEVEVSNESSLEDVIADHMYEGITAIDAPKGCENLHFEEICEE